MKNTETDQCTSRAFILFVFAFVCAISMERPKRTTQRQTSAPLEPSLPATGCLLPLENPPHNGSPHILLISHRLIAECSHKLLFKDSLTKFVFKSCHISTLFLKSMLTSNTIVVISSDRSSYSVSVLVEMLPMLPLVPLVPLLALLPLLPLQSMLRAEIV